jgi:hypothetical protein
MKMWQTIVAINEAIRDSKAVEVCKDTAPDWDDERVGVGMLSAAVTSMEQA